MAEFSFIFFQSLPKSSKVFQSLPKSSKVFQSLPKTDSKLIGIKRKAKLSSIIAAGEHWLSWFSLLKNHL